MMASISLVIAVQLNFCNQDFLKYHKFSMGLRSGYTPIYNIYIYFLKIVFTFSDERDGTIS